jgi:DNA-binding MarR family transcriptional regulator
MELTVDTDRRLDHVAVTLIQRAAGLSKVLLRRTRIGVTRTEAGVMTALSARPRRITELAAREVVTQPAMTLLVNRLEERGLVERGADPSDGRAVLVTLTTAGRDVIDRLRAEYGNLLERELGPLPDEDLETLFRAAEILERLRDGLAELEP